MEKIFAHSFWGDSEKSLLTQETPFARRIVAAKRLQETANASR
jgi:hypothetical protein